MSGQGFHKAHGLLCSFNSLVYQFIYTGYPIQYKSINGFATAQGSAVVARLPKVKDNTTIDWDKVNVIPTGSTLINLPNGTLKETDIQKIQFIHNLIQIQLVPEPVYYGFDDLTKKLHSKVVSSWSGQAGDVYCAGWFMPSNKAQLTDKGYDIPPAVVKNKRPLPRMPDSDWPDTACRVLVKSAQYGDRYFMVMVDARSRFYCWPDQYDSTEYLYPNDSPYIPQSIKTNVPNSQVKLVDPPFPGWVHSFPSGFTRRDQDWSEYRGEPRYVWRFHPQGTKAVGIVLKRERLTTHVFANHSDGGIPLKEYDAGELKIDVSWRGDGSVLWDDVQVDTYGLVEFGLNISITGVGRDQFSFSMSLLRQIEAGGSDYPIAADYLMPIEVTGGWASRGISAQPGELIVANLDLYPDVIDPLMYPRLLTNATQKSAVTIKSVDTSNVLLTFVCGDYPSVLKKHDVKELTVKEFFAEMRQLDLAKLNFSYLASVDQFAFDETHYATTTGDEGVDAKVMQRRLQTDIGLRVFVLGKKTYEQRFGSNLGVWSYADQTLTGLNRIAPSLVGTRWLGKESYSGERWYYHSLLSYVAKQYSVYASSFSTEMSNILTFLGGHSGLSESFRDYVPEYWDEYIIPAMTDIVDKTNERFTHTDIPLSPGTRVTTRHAVSLYNDIDLNYSDELLNYNSNLKFPKVYDYPICAEWYMNESNFIFNSQANFDVIADLSGYYAISLEFVYTESSIPNFSYFVGANSGLAITRYDDSDLPQYTYKDAEFSEVNKPNTTIFSLAQIDEVGHINGGKTSHAELYQRAYQASPTQHTLDAHVYTVNEMYDIYQNITYKLNGSSYVSKQWIFGREHNTALPRRNGSGYFL